MNSMPPMRRRQALIGLAGMLGPGAAWAQSPASDETRSLPPPAPGSLIEVPDVTLLDGSTLRAADTARQVLVLYWWASWCPFCAVQTPLIDALWRAQHERGLQVLGLSIDKQADDARRHLARKGHRFPSAWVSPALARELPKPRGLPVTVVLGRDRRVVMSEAGQLFPEDIEGIARFL